MGNAKFRSLPASELLGRFSENFAGLIASGIPNPTCVKLSPSGVYLFLFFDLMRLATGRPVVPIVAINGSNDAPWWPSRPFYHGFVNNTRQGFFEGGESDGVIYRSTLVAMVTKI